MLFVLPFYDDISDMTAAVSLRRGKLLDKLVPRNNEN